MVVGTEVIVAAADPQHGPVIMIGLGGIVVVALKDMAIRLLPVDEREAREMLRGYKILEDLRGREQGDIGALNPRHRRAVESLCRYRNWLEDVEINSLVVRQDRRGLSPSTSGDQKRLAEKADRSDVRVCHSRRWSIWHWRVRMS